MMRLIILIGLMILIVLQLRKIILSRKLNRMLELKQKQLRVKDEVATINSTRSPNFSLNLRLAASLAFAFALIVMPKNNISKPEASFKTSLLNSVSLNGTDNIKHSEVSLFRTANFMMDEEENKTILDGKFLYTLNTNKLTAYELHDKDVIKLRETLIDEYLADNIYKKGDHLFVLGRIEKEEAKNPLLVDKLDDKYDTVVDVFSTVDFKHINRLVFDGSFVDITLYDNQMTVVTKNDLFYELVDEDLILPWYKSKTYSRTYSYDNVKSNPLVDVETIYNAYTYDISDDFVKTYSVILDDEALIKAFKNDLYILSSTSDNKTLVARVSGEEYKEVVVDGDMSGYSDLYINRGSLYFITEENQDAVINKLDLDLNNYKSESLGLASLGAYGFVDSMLLYGNKDVHIFDLENMKLSESFESDNIIFFERVSPRTIVTLVEKEDNYFIKVLESNGVKLSEVANYRIKSFENSNLEFVEFYEDSGIMLVGINRGNFDELLYVIQIGTLGIENISIHDVSSLPANIYSKANIMEQYLYLANNHEVLVLSLVNEEDRAVIKLR